MVVLVAGCTQTAQVLDPATASCYAVCEPGKGCSVGFNAEEEIKTDQSVLIGTNVEEITIQETEE